jgi:hypothetical protein
VPQITTRTRAARLRRHIKSAAQDFAEWLNSSGEQQGLFWRLVDVTVAATKHEQQRKKIVNVLDPSDAFYTYQRKFNRLVNRIDKHPLPRRLNMLSWGLVDQLPTIREVAVRRSGSKEETRLLQLRTLEFLATHGAFANFHRCALPSCARGFFAFPRQQRYCSDDCQRVHYDEADQRKTNNRKYQRKHYREWKSAEAKRMQKLAARRGISGHRSLSDLQKVLKSR